MTRVHLIRHCEPRSGWGEAGGDPDPGLTDVGLRQADEVSRRLMALPAGVRPERILSSPLRRCRETARPFETAAGMSATVAPPVAEIPTPRNVEGPARAPWLRRAMGGAWSEIEGVDGLEWRSQVVAALLRAEGAAVFTHFVAINAAVSAATGSDAVLVFRPAPGSITTLRVEADRLVLEGLGNALDETGRVL